MIHVRRTCRFSLQPSLSHTKSTILKSYTKQQKSDCTNSKFLITPRPGVKVKLIQTGLKVKNLVVSRTKDRKELVHGRLIYVTRLNKVSLSSVLIL